MISINKQDGDTKGVWEHNFRKIGHVIVSHIIEVYPDEPEAEPRDIGWRVQDSINRVVFFIPAGSCTYLEANSYGKNMRTKGIDVKIISPEDFHQFLECMKNELDPIFYIAASCGVPEVQNDAALKAAKGGGE